MNKKEEYKIAYIAAAKTNGFSKALLAQLHKKSENAVDKYLYAKERYPSFSDIMELYCLVKAIGGKLPRELHRLVVRVNSRAISVAKSNGIYDQKNNLEVVGNVSRPHKYEYVLNGKTVSRADLALLNGINHVTVRQRLKALGIKNGDDVTEVDLSRKQT